MGRSYGDVCLNPCGLLWNTTALHRFIAFDEFSGRLTCEAGVLLRDIQRLAVLRGWMLPVTPGTQLITVGGAIANDVHGKNHHRAGSFGDHVLRLRLARTDGSTFDCGPTQCREWFQATIGGIGLTGVIVEADLQLRRVPGPWLHAETVPYASLSEFFALADASEAGWEYTVSWIDCVAKGSGRGVFMRANHTASDATGPSRARHLCVPVTPPVSLVNRLSLRPFNATYFHLKKRGAGGGLVHYEPFFYPLDNVRSWNRIYGPRGFFQYQCVIPRGKGCSEAMRALLDAVRASRDGSFLAVLKTFGDRMSTGLLSFPRSGATLALDFPNRGPATLQLLDRLDDIVASVGGRLYLAKDARMPRELFVAGYPALSTFAAFRDPGITSAMSRRLMGS